MATVDKEKICRTCTVIHTVLSSTNVDPFQATTKIGIEYFTKYFHTGVGYSYVNTARSFLSTVIKTENGIPFGELPLVCRFLIVLKYIKSLKALKQCDLKSPVVSYCNPSVYYN